MLFVIWYTAVLPFAVNVFEKEYRQNSPTTAYVIVMGIVYLFTMPSLCKVQRVHLVLTSAKFAEGDKFSMMRILNLRLSHYGDVLMDTMASQITSLTIVYSTVYSGTDQRKHQSSASLAFVRGIHRWPVNTAHKGSVTRKLFPFDDVIMTKSGEKRVIEME